MVLGTLVSSVEFLNNLVPFLKPFFIAPGILLLFIPLVILLFIFYTIRSHPKNITVPSLMFILNQGNKMSPKRFFRRLPLNLLLLLHILLLASLIIAAAQPYLLRQRSDHANHVIIIIDASMSMQAGNRFQEAKAQAITALGKTNTIIVIHDTPQVLATDVSKATARSLLSSLKVSDSVTALHTALQAAVDMNTENAVIHIYSDGMATIPSTTTISGLTAKLQSQNNAVFFHEFTQGTNNVGIINAQIDKNETVVQIRNYNEYDISITAKLNDNIVEVPIVANGIASARFSTPPGKSTLTLDVDDEVPGDNILYISAPERKIFDILYVSNNHDPYLRLALSLMDFINVKYETPPGENIKDYDAYILGDLDPRLVLPSTIVDVATRVNRTAGVIVLMTPSMAELEWHGLLAAQPQTSIVRSPITTFNSKYVEDIAIGGTQPHLLAEKIAGAEVLAGGQNGVALARKPYGNGVTYYYGIQQDGDFAQDFTFPLLFKRWLEDIVYVVPIEDANVRTGTILGNPGSLSKYPDGKTVDGQIATKNAGFYEIDGNIYAVNTLSDAESGIARKSIETTTTGTADLSSEDNKTPYGLWKYFAMLALIIIALEYLLLKYRGDA